MHALGPGPELEAEWVSAGLRLPDRPAIRRYRLERVRSQLRAAGCDAALLYDPLNIRYATDTTNMSIWTMHNAVRYAFVATDGPVVLFEFSKGEFLDTHSEVVDEIRPGLSYIYFYAGSRAEEVSDWWAQEIADLLGEHGRGDRRLAIDRIDLLGVRALERRGVCLVDAGGLMEEARVVKSSEEITAMRCAVHACEAAIAEMQAAFEPGITEMALWAVLQAGNYNRYGEWIETRLLASGPRHQPVVPGSQQPPGAGGGADGFRHRHDLRLRRVRGHLPDLAVRGAGARRRPSTTCGRWPLSRSSATSNCTNPAPR